MALRITLVTVGTRGDFQPFLALAEGLRAAGQTVVLATHTDFEAETRAHGFEFRPFAGSFRAVLESDVGRDWIESGDSPTRYLKTARRFFGDLHAMGLRDAARVVDGADAVVFHPFAYAVVHPAEKAGQRLAIASLVPFHSTGVGRLMTWNAAPQWSWLRRALSKWGARLLGALASEQHNAHRRDLGLAPLSDGLWDELVARGVPMFHLYSGHLSPRPSDWPDLAQVCGFCVLQEREAPSADLEAFVAAGPPPLYVGFGSMTGRDPAALGALALEAVRRVGKRAVIATGWGGLKDLSSDGQVLVTSHAPHGWLFPRTEAIVHHGGAGTTAASLRAGKPTVVASFFGDQPFWGALVHAAGAGPKPLHRARLTAERLAQAIDSACREPSYRVAAEAMAAKLNAEDGVAAATSALLKALSPKAA